MGQDRSALVGTFEFVRLCATYAARHKFCACFIFDVGILFNLDPGPKGDSNLKALCRSHLTIVRVDLAKGSNYEHPLPNCQGSHNVSWLHSDREKDCGLKIHLTSPANF